VSDWDRDLRSAPKDRPVRLLDGGKERRGQWNADAGVWVSVVDPTKRLRPIAWREYPAACLTS